MKKIFIYYFIVLVQVSCINYEEKMCKTGLPDREYECFESIKQSYDYNSNYLDAITNIRELGTSLSRDDIGYLWVRNPKNLELFYHSVKSIGLFKFISIEEFNTPLFTDHWAETCWANKSLNQITQNFILAYSDSVNIDPYYSKFWERRRKEANDSIAYEILKDMSEIYNHSNRDSVTYEKIDSLIFNLLNFELQLKQNASSKIDSTVKDYFNYLISKGLYASAANIMYYYKEHNEISEIEASKYLEKIETDSLPCNLYWEWRRNAIWFRDVDDSAAYY